MFRYLFNFLYNIGIFIMITIYRHVIGSYKLIGTSIIKHWFLLVNVKCCMLGILFITTRNN